MLLDAYRVLDLTDHRGQFCGKILADMGADVVKIEPPGGDPSRAIGPFLGNDPHPEKSLYWLALNTNKRSITLNIEKREGKQLFLDMVKNARFLIESFPPDYSNRLGLSYTALSEVNPSLVVVSITPFGNTGPYSRFKDSELINMGLGGQMTLCGDPDRPPLGFPAAQSYFLGGMNAVIGALTAHLFREQTGKGQHVDVSVQESVFLTTFNLQPFWELQGVHLRRQGSRAMRGEITFRTCWPCRDGYVSWRIFTGGWGRWTRSLVQWMAEKGTAGDLDAFPWEDTDMNTLSQEQVNHFEAAFGNFFLKHSKDEIFRWARKAKVPLLPVNTPADVFRDEQLASRHFWRNVVYREHGLTIKHPGPAFQPFGEVIPLRRAPHIGEHNTAIYVEEMGISKKSLHELSHTGVV